eukprot:761766-Hanusia_phi.AAC.2
MNYACYQFGWSPATVVPDFRRKLPVQILLTKEAESNGVYKYFDKMDLQVMMETCRYCISPPQTLQNVADLYATSVFTLRMANPDTTAGLEEVFLRGAVGNSSHTINVGVVYRVMPGDYFDLLARKFYMTLDQIERVNPGIADNVLQPVSRLVLGDELCIVPSICNIKCIYPAQCSAAV